jgi:hypothetical protein
MSVLGQFGPISSDRRLQFYYTTSLQHEAESQEPSSAKAAIYRLSVQQLVLEQSLSQFTTQTRKLILKK